MIKARKYEGYSLRNLETVYIIYQALKDRFFIAINPSTLCYSTYYT